MHTTKLFALLMALLLVVGLLASCQSTEPPTEEPESSTATDVPVADEPAETPAEVSYFPRPDGTTLSIWYTPPGYAGLDGDWNAVPGYMALEDLTNVHLEWETASQAAASEMFNIMIVSGEYPDLLQGFNGYYTRGLDNAVEEDIIIPLTEEIPMYMPIYDGLIQADPNFVRRTMTDSGMRASVHCIYTVPQMPWCGLIIRQDWLDRLGVETPRTYDQLYDVLVAFRDDIGAEAPMCLGSIGDSEVIGMSIGYAFSGGFGAPNNMIQKDGKVAYGPLEPGFKEYIETMSKWYAEGLINRDFASGAIDVLSEYAYNDRTGLWFGFGQGTAAEHAAAVDPNYHAVGIQNFVKDEAQGTSHLCVEGAGIGIGTCVSTQCEDVELALRWMDFCYGEGAIPLNFGYEGEHFYFDENGEPIMDEEKIAAYFDDAWGPVRQATGPVEAPYLRYMDQGLPMKKSTTPASEESVNVAWKYDDNDWSIPSGISMTVEESETYYSIIMDAQTMVTEYTVKMINGDFPLSKYDELVDSLKAQGIDDAISVMQAAVDRYFARGTK